MTGTSWARAARNKSSSARGSIVTLGSSNNARTRSPSALAPGSRTNTAPTDSASRDACVDLPTPSVPSSTMRRPGMGRRLTQRDDRALRALPNAVQDPVVHVDHGLIEVLLRGNRPLIDRLALDLAEQVIELTLHIGRGAFPALDQLLGVGADLLHLLERRHGLTIAVQRLVGPFHRLVLRALADQSTELYRPLLERHSVPPIGSSPCNNKSISVRQVAPNVDVDIPSVGYEDLYHTRRPTGVDLQRQQPAGDQHSARLT